VSDLAVVVDEGLLVARQYAMARPALRLRAWSGVTSTSLRVPSWFLLRKVYVGSFVAPLSGSERTAGEVQGKLTSPDLRFVAVPRRSDARRRAECGSASDLPLDVVHLARPAASRLQTVLSRRRGTSDGTEPR
jgi:hypothetical protein